MNCKIDITTMNYGRNNTVEEIINSAKEFLSQHPIDWSRYDDSCIEDGYMSIEAFTDQQGWSFYEGSEECRDYHLYGELGYFISAAIALDKSAPEEVLIALVPEVDEPSTALHALLTNPSSTESVLEAIYNSFYYGDEYVLRDMKILQKLFKHPNLTENVMDIFASNAVERADGEALYNFTRLEETPAVFLELLFKHSCAYHGKSDFGSIFYCLAEAANATPKLIEAIINYMLDIDFNDLDDYAHDEFLDTVTQILTSSKISEHLVEKMVDKVLSLDSIESNGSFDEVDFICEVKSIIESSTHSDILKDKCKTLLNKFSICDRRN